MESTTQTQKRDVYTIVTNRIIAQLEKGTVPWKQNWREAEMPANLISGNKYRGINVLLLSSLGYARNYFLTFHQLNELAGSVKEGEKPCPVVYWKTFAEEPVEDGMEAKPKRKPVLRYYNVYNIAQCEGIPEEGIPALPQAMEPDESCESILVDMPDKPEIIQRGDRAFYTPLHDQVYMPSTHHFQDAEAYYETLFHELIHSTGHPKRLNRKELNELTSMHSESYSIEELTAEIGACFLKAFAGMESRYFENNVAYVQGWLNRLKNDNRFIVYACTQAQKAADYILNANSNGKKEVPDESAKQ